jgi:hypothetical protein
MKKAIYTVGAVAAVLLVIGFGLLILASWGSLVEYHAFEWRGVDPAGASPLVMATNNLSLWFLGIGFLTGIITFIMFFTISIKNTCKKRSAHHGQTS